MLQALTRLAGFVMLWFLAVASAQAENAIPGAQFVNGKHYQLIEPPQPTTTGAAIEVLEAFSYACPHCNDFEPVVNDWLTKQPADVLFRRLPVVFKDSWAALAKAYYAAELLNITSKINGPLFNALHVEKRKLEDEAALTDFFAEQGVKKDDFSKAFNSFSVDSKVRQAVQSAGKYHITGVPTLVVNGKYQTSASLAGDYATMLKVVDFLIANERGQGKKSQ
jgi:protein dithiol oxidoreductase (disulfide-forming)